MSEASVGGADLAGDTSTGASSGGAEHGKGDDVKLPPGLFFGEVALDDAGGATLAHSLLVDGERWAKGRILTPGDVARARAGGIGQVTVARLAEGDVAENAAAAALAAALAGAGVAAAAAAHGRANFIATADGIMVIDLSAIAAVNAVNEGITVGTLTPFARVAAGEVVATVKIIPFAVDGASLDATIRAAAGLDNADGFLSAAGPIADLTGDVTGRAASIENSAAAVQVAAFTPRHFVLIQTRLPATTDKMLARTDAVTRTRIIALGSTLAGWTECDHSVNALAAVLAAQPVDAIILIAGASATADRRDVIPAAILTAGGNIERLGMPVDPGNLLCLGHLDGRAVIGLPGCARSPKRNGFDWVVERLAAGIEVTSASIAAMGVGGLLPEAERPQPRVATDNGAAGAGAGRVGAILLAAGRSSRWQEAHSGTANKLLADLDGQPVICHVVAAIAAAGLPPPIVVTGHMTAEVRAALASYTVTFVDAPDFANGMSRSLAAGLAAAPPDWYAALVVLGDMPRVGATTLTALVAAATDEHVVAVPIWNGKRGNPVAWGRAHWPTLWALTGDVGGKALLADSDVIEVTADSDGILADVDTPEALAAMRENTRPDAGWLSQKKDCHPRESGDP